VISFIPTGPGGQMCSTVSKTTLSAKGETFNQFSRLIEREREHDEGNQ